MEEPKYIRDISPKKTLLTMQVGETVVIPTRLVQSGTLRVVASRLQKRREGRFIVTTEGLVNKTQVTRLK